MVKLLSVIFEGEEVGRGVRSAELLGGLELVRAEEGEALVGHAVRALHASRLVLLFTTGIAEGHAQDEKRCQKNVCPHR